MKKILVWLLVLTMALSLLGCGKEPVEIEDEPFYGDEFIPIPSIDPVVPDIEDEFEITPEVAYWTERIAGEYIGCYFEVGELERIVMNADKTCTVGGKNYTWEFRKHATDPKYICSEDSALLDVYDGDTVVYEMNTSVSPIGFFSLTVDNLTDSTPSGLFYNTNEFDVVELTTDNWLDYFEYAEYIRPYRNDSGEVHTLNIHSVYQVKEAYSYATTGYFPDVRIDYTFYQVQQKYTADPETCTYEWGEVISRDGPREGYMDEMDRLFVEDLLDCYGFSFVSPDIEKFPEGKVWRETDCQMNNISGVIALYPKQ